MTEFETAQVVTASAAVFIAFLALFLSILEASRARKHYRLSLKPMLVLDITKGNNPTMAAVSVVNSGLGPARINSMKVFLSGKEVDTDDEAFKSLLESLLGDLSVRQISVSIINIGYVLRSAQACQLVKVVLATEEKSSPKELARRLDAVDVSIEFESFYKEVDIYDSRQ